MASARRALLATTLAALVVRLVIFPWFANLTPHIYDEGDYSDIATSLAQHGEFAMNGRITSARPPLYPAMVAAVYRVAGVGNHQAVRLLQILLNVAIVPLVFMLGRRLYDQRTGLVAAALAGFYPSLFGHDYLILTEVLFTFLLVAGMLALVEFSRAPADRSARDRSPAGAPAAAALERDAARPPWALLVFAGLAFGLGALTRTSLLFYPPLYAIAMFALWRAPSPRRIAAVLLFTATFALTIAPWIARNTRLHGRLSSIDSYSNSTAAKFSPLRHLFEEPGSNWATPPARERGGLWEGREGSVSTAVRRDRSPAVAAPVERSGQAPSSSREGQGRQEGRERRVRQQPQEPQGPQGLQGFGIRLGRVVSGVVRDALLFWRIDRELAGAAARGWLGPLPRPLVLGLTAMVAGYYVVLALAGALGLVLRPPPDRLQLALVLSVIAVLFAVHAFSVGHSRYHIPLMPLLAVFAARLWVARAQPVARRRLAAGVALAAILIASWIAAFVRFDLPDVRERLEWRGRPGADARID